MAKKRMKPNPPLAIYYQNVNGLKSKEKNQEFLRNVKLNNYDVICLTETNFNSNLADSLLFDDRYVVFRHDRNLQPTKETPKPKKSGGGVLIAVKKALVPTHLILPNGSELGEAEDVWVTITLANGKQINICCAYIPGYSGRQMTSHLASLRANPEILENSILVGDYNIPKVDFNAENVSEDLLKEKRKAFKEMAKFIRDSNLTQYNSFKNKNEVALDLVLSLMKIEVILAERPLVRIDGHHPPVIIKLIDDNDSSSSDESDSDEKKEQEERIETAVVDPLPIVLEAVVEVVAGAVVVAGVAAVVVGVGICVANFPVLIPALPVAGKSAVASAVAVKQMLVVSTVATVSVGLMMFKKFW